MDKYSVRIRPEALKMLDSIYENICDKSLDESNAENLISHIEKDILSLEQMPRRGSEIVAGVFANCGYRKLIIKNHIIVYTILETRKEVIVIFVNSSKMQI